jgi:hypothetical protein
MNIESNTTSFHPRSKDALAALNLLSHFENFFLAPWRLGG